MIPCPNTAKPCGLIIRKSDYSRPRQQHAQQHLPTSQNLLNNLATITTNASYKMPGQIKSTNRHSIPTADQQTYYNSDIYHSPQQHNEKIKYESAQQVLLPVKERSKSLNAQQHPKMTSTRTPLYSIQQQSREKMLNIHGKFDLQQYRQLSTLLLNMTLSYNQNELQFLQNCRLYLQLSGSSGVAGVGHIKMTEQKRQVIRQCFVAQRQCVLGICLSIATKSEDKYRSYCSNLLKYIYQNNLTILNLLTHQANPFVIKLIHSFQKGYLIGKGFQLLKNNLEIIHDHIRTILNADLLFAEEYYRIVQHTNQQEVHLISHALLTFFAFYLHARNLQHSLPFLACAASPYLVQQSTHQYTLVIDFMRVLLKDGEHSRKQKRHRQAVSVRPYAQHFIKQMAKYYEIVSFSNSMPTECNSIISSIDQTAAVKHRLYKYHFSNGKRDMARLGRQNDKLILIDTVQDQQNKHLMLVSSWKGQPSDAQLAEICPLLALIAVKQLSALCGLQRIREGVRSNKSVGLNYINCNLSL